MENMKNKRENLFLSIICNIMFPVILLKRGRGWIKNYLLSDFENISSVREINFSDLKPKFNQVERFFESSKKIDYLNFLRTRLEL